MREMQKDPYRKFDIFVSYRFEVRSSWRTSKRPVLEAKVQILVVLELLMLLAEFVCMYPNENIVYHSTVVVPGFITDIYLPDLWDARSKPSPEPKKALGRAGAGRRQNILICSG